MKEKAKNSKFSEESFRVTKNERTEHSRAGDSLFGILESNEDRVQNPAHDGQNDRAQNRGAPGLNLKARQNRSAYLENGPVDDKGEQSQSQNIDWESQKEKHGANNDVRKSNHNRRKQRIRETSNLKASDQIGREQQRKSRDHPMQNIWNKA